MPTVPLFIFLKNSEKSDRQTERQWSSLRDVPTLWGHGIITYMYTQCTLAVYTLLM